MAPQAARDPGQRPPISEGHAPGPGVPKLVQPQRLGPRSPQPRASWCPVPSPCPRHQFSSIRGEDCLSHPRETAPPGTPDHLVSLRLPPFSSENIKKPSGKCPLSSAILHPPTGLSRDGDAAPGPGNLPVPQPGSLPIRPTSLQRPPLGTPNPLPSCFPPDTRRSWCLYPHPSTLLVQLH